jgi:hypothetical protein
VLGEDGRDGLPHEPHPVACEERPDHRPVRGREQQRGREVEVGSGEHRDDAGRGLGRLDVDPGDPAVRQWGPDEREVQRTGQPLVGQVVGVGRSPREEHRILCADHPRAHDAHRGGC